MMLIRGLTLSTALLLSSSLISNSADLPPTTPDTNQIVVTAQAAPESPTAPSIAESQEQKKEVAGGFTIRSAAEMEKGRASNFEDLLERTPGLSLQTDNGAEITKISIRGSGILSEDEPLGIQFLLDGLTFNQADGEAILEDFDLATIKYAEIFRGANAFKYGSITLGGAINLITSTGYEADPFRVRLESGSYGYFRSQIGFAGVVDSFDYLGSLMARYRDGFREHNRENTERMFGDIGYRFSDAFESRFYLTVDRVDRQLPGGLTKEELNDNPQQANPDAIAQDLNKKWDLVRLAEKISYKADLYDFNFGLFWFHRNEEERGFFSSDFHQGVTAFYSDNYGLTLNSVRRDELFGHRNVLSIGLTPQVEREVSQNFQNLGGHRGQTTALNTGFSINAPFYGEDQFYLTKQFSFLVGFQAIYAQRDFEDQFVSDANGDQSHRQEFYGWNPKTALLYEFGMNKQAFLNFNGSWQPPSFNNLVEFTEGPDSSILYTPLHPHRARTVEIGTRGQHGRFEWDLSLYRTWLRNELLQLNDAQGNDLGAVNVQRSSHQGIEAGLNIELLGDSFPGEPNVNDRNRLTLSQTYTLNNFRFDGDPVYNNNRIAGIPIHLYEAELIYTIPAGFYAGLNVRWIPTRYPVDQANTLFVDPYSLWGFKLGYQRQKGPSFFIEAKNLTDKRFPSAIDPIADARIAPGAEIFHPGDGRAFYGGISYSW